MNDEPRLKLNAADADKITHTDEGVLFEWYNRDGRDYQMLIEDAGIKLAKAAKDNPSTNLVALGPYITLTSSATKHGG